MPVTVHLASVLAVARFSVLLGTHCRARCSTPREIRIQNFTFLIIKTVLVFIKQELLQIRILRFPSPARSSRDRWEVLLILNFENSLALSIHCTKEWNYFHPQQNLC